MNDTDTQGHAPFRDSQRGVPTFGLFLNTGACLGRTHTEVFERTLEEVALTFAAFLLGRTRRLRVGTAVTLTPHYHPLQLAEQGAILDQTSSGRFDFGIGRGGYLQEYQVFGTPVARWDDEVEATVDVLLSAWTQETVESYCQWFPFPVTSVNPRPWTRPHPPLFLATSTPAGITRAARDSLPLLHYWGTPVASRQRVEAQYAAVQTSVGGLAPAHVHSLITLVTDDEARARRALREHLITSFRAGDWPHVPQAQPRHVGPDGQPLDRDTRASVVAEQAIVGPPAAVIAGLHAFCESTNASRLVLFMEPIVERDLLLMSIERFAKEVVPAFTGRTAGRAVAQGRYRL